MSSRRSLPVLAGLLLAAPLAGSAQEREVISKQIAVARGEAALHLELAGGDLVDVRLAGGEVRADDAVLGSYEPGGELERAWRALLGQAVALDDGPLARALVEWEPPELEGEAAAVAAALDRTLEEALRAPAAPPAPAPPLAPSPSAEDEARELVEALLGRSGRLLQLADAVGGLDAEARRSLRPVVGRELRVEEGDTVEGGLLVVDGDVRVAGVVTGSVVLVGGSLTLEEGGRVSGDVRLADDARLFRDGGAVGGNVETVRASGRGDIERDLRERLREEIRSEIRGEIRGELRDELRNEIRNATRVRADGGWNPLRSIGRGLGGLLENLVSVLVLGVLVGGLAVHFASPNLDVVARTVREAPLRAAMVGVAGAFVALPAWVLGFVALAISIVGILAIPFWAVLFPVALAAGIAVGYVAVAQILGEWVARQRYERLEWVRIGNPYSTVVAGVAVLMLAFMLSNVLEMAGPWTGVFQGILVFLGVVASVGAALTGFGAVLLTRGGRRPEYGGGDLEDWGLDLGAAGPAGPAGFGGGSTGHAPGSGSSRAPEAPASGAPESGSARGTGERGGAGDADATGAPEEPRREDRAPGEEG